MCIFHKLVHGLVEISVQYSTGEPFANWRYTEINEPLDNVRVRASVTKLINIDSFCTNSIS